jgi:metal-dependent HD superfamily phosphatase/phosphodiesterase
MHGETAAQIERFRSLQRMNKLKSTNKILRLGTLLTSSGVETAVVVDGVEDAAESVALLKYSVTAASENEN